MNRFAVYLAAVVAIRLFLPCAVTAEDPFGLRTLGETLDTKVVTVTKQKEDILKTDAAVTVITQKELLRFGARNLHDALRLAPGFGVRKIDQSKTAIRARQNYDRFHNSILVLVDGRTMFNETFYGVLWETLDLPIEEIERIEIIRGPAGSLWGANAVDGIVNIITRPPRENEPTTVGATLSHRGDGRLYGGHTFKIGPNTLARWHAQGRQHQDSSRAWQGRDAHDAYQSLTAGIQLEHTPSLQDLVRISAGLYDSANDEIKIRSTATPPYWDDSLDTLELSGGHFQLEWDHLVNASTFSKVRLYGMSNIIKSDYADIEETIYDLEWNVNAKVLDRHRVNFGAGLRYNHSESAPTRLLRVGIDDLHVTSVHGFVQDRVELIEDSLYLTLGSKIEYNESIDIQVQPSARLLYTKNEDISFWGAISRAVRTPARIEYDDSRILLQSLPPGALGPGTPVSITSFAGNPDIGEEESVTYELGMRGIFSEKLLLDAALFYKDADKLRTFSSGAPMLSTLDGIPVLEVPVVIGDGASATSYGLELAAEFKMNERWHVGGYYNFTHADRSAPMEERSVSDDGLLAYPEHEFLLHLAYDHSERLAFDGWLEYSDNLLGLTGDVTKIRLRCGYEINPNWQMDLIVENLLNDGEIDYNAEDSIIRIAPSEADTTVFLQTRYEF